MYNPFSKFRLKMTISGIFSIANALKKGIKTNPEMFDFSRHMLFLIEDIVKRVPVFSHIRPRQILISASQAKNTGLNGTWAEIYPMKYENGHYSIREKKGQKVYHFKTDQLKVGRTEILYIMYFIMPRFQNLSFTQKLDTIFHELYHISPEFDGKIRTINKRYKFHGYSMKAYDRNVRHWVKYYLKSKPSQRRLQFLGYSFYDLKQKYRVLELVTIPQPKETYKVMVSRKKPAKRKKKTN